MPWVGSLAYAVVPLKHASKQMLTSADFFLRFPGDRFRKRTVTRGSWNVMTSKSNTLLIYFIKVYRLLTDRYFFQFENDQEISRKITPCFSRVSTSNIIAYGVNCVYISTAATKNTSTIHQLQQSTHYYLVPTFLKKTWT